MMRVLIAIAILFSASAIAQDQPQAGSTSMPGMDMSHDAGGMHNMTGDSEAMQSMQLHHMNMGPHMKMTALRQPQPGDKQKAADVAEAARAVAEKYRDYKVALADGYQIFLPNVPQKQYHFTNYRNGWLARDHFDPSRPTSLLYEKNGDGYKLVGVMYTARKDATEDELNARIPLSIAEWHAHVNLCVPSLTRREDVIQPGHKFGLTGSIATKEECDAAGGKFFPQVFGWMVHVYPFEKNPADVWSVERQAHMD
jgi:hypothetical protein